MADAKLAVVALISVIFNCVVGSVAFDELDFSKATASTVIVKYATTFKDPARKNREVPTIIYYPSNATGQGLPLVVFAHCYLGFDTWYEYIVNVTVPRGYIMAMVGTYNADPVTSPNDLADDQSFLLDHIVELASTDRTFVLYGMLGTTYAAAGHSLGGAASFINGNTRNVRRTAVHNFTSIFTLSGCQPPPGDEILAALSHDTLPALLLSGTTDCMCGPFGPTYYMRLPSKCKYFVDIVNATHCQMADMWFDNVVADACHITEEALGCQIDKKLLTMTEQLYMVNRYVQPWIDFSLKGDASARTVLDQLFAKDVANGLVQGSTGCLA